MSLYSFISTDLISRLISSHFVWVLLNIPLKIFLLTVFWCFVFFLNRTRGLFPHYLVLFILDHVVASSLIGNIFKVPIRLET